MSECFLEYSSTYHDCGGRCAAGLLLCCPFLSAPTISDIRAPSLLTNCVEFKASEVAFDFVEGGAGWNACFQM